MAIRYYKAYNLIIKSDITIIGLKPIFSKYYDIEILSSVSNDNYFNDYKEEINQGYYRLEIKNLAAFEIIGLNKIFVNYKRSANLTSISFFILGHCLGAILFQKGYFLLHASGIENNKKGMFFTGTFGSGKSSVLNSFIMKNYKMISDDISAINLNPKPNVTPSFPITNISIKTAEKLNIEISNLKKVHQDFEKYSLSLGNKAFCADICNINIIYEMNIDPNNNLRIENVSNFEKYKIIQNNIYKFRYYKSLIDDRNQINQLNKIVNNVKVKKVFRTNNINDLDSLINLIERDFQKNE